MIRAEKVLPPEERMRLQLEAEKITFVRQFRFHNKRKWKADFFVGGARRVIIEVEGGTRMPGGGRHQRGTGFEEDCIKYGEATVMGYLVLRVTGDMIDKGIALNLVKRALMKPVGALLGSAVSCQGSERQHPLVEETMLGLWAEISPPQRKC